MSDPFGGWLEESLCGKVRARLWTVIFEAFGGLFRRI
jgi:hypothetical protein